MSQATPIVLLDEAQTEQTPTFLYWLAHLGIWSLALQVYLALTAVLIGPLMQVFKDFKVELPAVTIFLVQLYRWLHQDLFAFIAMLALPIIVASFAAIWPGGTERQAALKVVRLDFRVAFYLTLLNVVVHLLAFLLPWITLLRSVSGVPK